MPPCAKLLPGLLVGLFRRDPNQFVEDVAHLDVVDAIGRQIGLGPGVIGVLAFSTGKICEIWAARCASVDACIPRSAAFLLDASDNSP